VRRPMTARNRTASVQQRSGIGIILLVNASDLWYASGTIHPIFDPWCARGLPVATSAVSNLTIGPAPPTDATRDATSLNLATFQAFCDHSIDLPLFTILALDMWVGLLVVQNDLHILVCAERRSCQRPFLRGRGQVALVRKECCELGIPRPQLEKLRRGEIAKLRVVLSTRLYTHVRIHELSTVAVPALRGHVAPRAPILRIRVVPQAAAVVLHGKIRDWAIAA